MIQDLSWYYSFASLQVYEVLTCYRDGIQFVHDQTVRHMNKGKHPIEIARSIQLPSTLVAKPYLQVLASIKFFTIIIKLLSLKSELYQVIWIFCLIHLCGSCRFICILLGLVTPLFSLCFVVMRVLHPIAIYSYGSY